MVANRPIPNTLTRSIRTQSREPVDERCWAFMKELRQHYKGRACYPVDPFAEVYPIRSNTYAIFNESLDGMGDVWLYLIIGPEKAMLIDTGFGAGNLKGLCNQLSGGKELVVVNTHPHVDHALGNCQFDRVYCHEYAVPTLQKLNRPQAWDYLFDKTGKPIWADFRREDLITYRSYEIVGLPDGYIFSLGQGYEVELIFTAGHASGHCMFLDKTNRLLFAGDDVISMRIGIGGPAPDDPYGKYATVNAFHEQLCKLAQRLEEFDYIFPGHFVFELENLVIQDLVEATAAILDHPEQCHAVEHIQRGDVSFTRMHRQVYGLGTIAYTNRSILHMD